MALVDLKLSPADKKSEMEERMAGPDAMPDYPYGMCLMIDKDELDKLGMTELPEVGDELNITAIAKVTQVRQSAVEGQDDESSISIQIMKMELTDSDEATEPNKTKKTALG